MTRPDDASLDVLREVWHADGTTAADLDDLDAPKVCKRTNGLDFAGFSDPADVGADGDIRTAWRARLAREGKLSSSGGSLRDLVLGIGTARPDTARPDTEVSR